VDFRYLVYRDQHDFLGLYSGFYKDRAIIANFLALVWFSHLAAAAPILKKGVGGVALAVGCWFRSTKLSNDHRG
jgi:hypothetical protein